MKKTKWLSLILLTISLLLVACSDTKDSKKESEETNSANNSIEDNSEIDDDTETQPNDANDANEVEDQLNLGIGDTGTFDTTLGTYEVTLVSAKLEDDIDGQSSELDRFIVLDLTVKNTSEGEQKVEDLLYSLEVTDYLDGSGFSDASEHVDSIEKMSGVIAPGEEMSGQLVTFVYNADEYYFRKDPGNIAGGSSNQVIWTIKADEV